MTCLIVTVASHNDCADIGSTLSDSHGDMSCLKKTLHRPSWATAESLDGF